MFEKIAFTMFNVEDPARARDFYEQVLGLTRGLASPDGTWTEYDLPGGGCLALFRHPNPEYAGKPGGASVALEVSDLDALNARLQEAGVHYLGDVVRGPHCRMSNILDSEGNGLILHELDADKKAELAKTQITKIELPASAARNKARGPSAPAKAAKHAKTKLAKPTTTRTMKTKVLPRPVAKPVAKAKTKTKPPSRR